MDYVQAIILGLLQGATELFPVSSLGHSVILPKLLGWNDIVAAQKTSESFFLAFLVGLHVATALALLYFYRERWVRMILAVIDSARSRQIDSADARLGWLLFVATIPAGLAGLLLEHSLRVAFATPVAAAVLLFVNGLILLGGERYRTRPAARRRTGAHRVTAPLDGHFERIGFGTSIVIGFAQALALLPGISRSGITMVVGLTRGLDHEDAADFSFLLATPIILAAGVYKLPDLLGHNGDGVRGQILVGSVAAAVAAYFSVRFLRRYFVQRTLTPFGIYCLGAGAVAFVLTR
ncbi:MAG TPA: undecaprenyl-diphosphate phosphatase [Candidatus Saccharimonadales bacterium]|nr:undecaprenyl-diphosphate phosphatase [Candidatus Saccharimonadales bacterium]